MSLCHASGNTHLKLVSLNSIGFTVESLLNKISILMYSKFKTIISKLFPVVGL